jgi:hypothetical protein
LETVVPPSKILADVNSGLTRYTSIYFDVFKPHDPQPMNSHGQVRRGNYLGHYHILSFIHYELSEAVEAITYHREHPSSVNQPFNVWIEALEQFALSLQSSVGQMRDICLKLNEKMENRDDYPREDYLRDVAAHEETGQRTKDLVRDVNRLLQEVMAAG